MGTLKHLATGTTHSLSSPHIVGRARTSALRLDNRLVSGEHAVFRWNGSHWELRDLNSSNGTFMGEHRLGLGELVPVAAGATVAFGDPDDLYEMVDDSPPEAVARADSGDVRRAEGGLLILPDAECPEVTVLEESPGHWVVESTQGERRPISDQGQIDAGGQSWLLEFPSVLEKTWQPDSDQMSLHRLRMCFSVSRDEEHVEIELRQRRQVTPLPPRAHNYLLLTLARARATDQADDSLAESEHGWVYFPDLIKMLGSNENQVNVAIYRARRQFALAKILGAGDLFERRPGTRQIRLGVKKVEIHSL